MGGHGAPLGRKIVTVVPGTSYSVTIGAGGALGVGQTAGTGGSGSIAGSAGSNTTFGALATFRGADANRTLAAGANPLIVSDLAGAGGVREVAQKTPSLNGGCSGGVGGRNDANYAPGESGRGAQVDELAPYVNGTGNAEYAGGTAGANGTGPGKDGGGGGGGGAGPYGAGANGGIGDNSAIGSAPSGGSNGASAAANTGAGGGGGGGGACRTDSSAPSGGWLGGTGGSGQLTVSWVE